jgi:hypothetical protein
LTRTSGSASVLPLAAAVPLVTLLKNKHSLLVRRFLVFRIVTTKDRGMTSFEAFSGGVCMLLINDGLHRIHYFQEMLRNSCVSTY